MLFAVNPNLLSSPKAERASTSLPLHTGTGQLSERRESGVSAKACAYRRACAVKNKFAEGHSRGPRTAGLGLIFLEPFV